MCWHSEVIEAETLLLVMYFKVKQSTLSWKKQFTFLSRDPWRKLKLEGWLNPLHGTKIAITAKKKILFATTGLVGMENRYLTSSTLRYLFLGVKLCYIPSRTNCITRLWTMTRLSDVSSTYAKNCLIIYRFTKFPTPW